MTLDQQIAFVILLGMVALFIWGRLRYDLVALLALLAAMVSGIVPPERAFSGFSDEVVIIIASALVLSAAVSKSGLVGRLIRRLEPLMTTTQLQVAVLAPAVTFLSVFLKNIGALAIFLPFALQIARRSGTPPSKLLMPLSFGSLIGGLVTLVGTSPNLLVSRVREDILGEPFGMFDFAPVGLGIVVAGLTFLLVGWRLLPSERRGRASAKEAFRVEPYLSEVRLPPGSPMVGKTVAAFEAKGGDGVSVVAIIREKHRRLVPSADWTLRRDDILVLRSDPHVLQTMIGEAGLQLVGTEESVTKGLSAEGVSVVEAVVMALSPLVGCSPAELRLRERHAVNLIAISRQGQQITARLRHLKFQAGDVLVLQGSA
jgi:di/tricarboxylate transporter